MLTNNRHCIILFLITQLLASTALCKSTVLEANSQTTIADIATNKVYWLDFVAISEVATKVILKTQDNKVISNDVLEFENSPMSLISVKNLLSHFVAIEYSHRCGTACDVRRTEIISVKNGKIYRCATFFNLVDDRLGHYRYNVQYSIRQEGKGYKMEAKETTMYFSDKYPQRNKKELSKKRRKSRNVFAFDMENMFFHSPHKFNTSSLSAIERKDVKCSGYLPQLALSEQVICLCNGQLVVVQDNVRP